MYVLTNSLATYDKAKANGNFRLTKLVFPNFVLTKAVFTILKLYEIMFIIKKYALYLFISMAKYKALI